MAQGAPGRGRGVNEPVLCAEFTATLLVPLRDARTVEEAQAILATMRTAEVFGAFEWYTMSAPRIVQETLPAPVITPATSTASNVTRLRPPARSAPRRKRTSTTRPARESVEATARKHYQPGMSASELARVAHMGKSAASKYARLLSSESRQFEQAAQ